MITDHRHKFKRWWIKKTHRKKFKDQKSKLKQETNMFYNSSNLNTNSNYTSTIGQQERILNESVLTELHNSTMMYMIKWSKFNTTRSYSEELSNSECVQLILKNNSKDNDNNYKERIQLPETNSKPYEVNSVNGLYKTYHLETTLQIKENFTHKENRRNLLKFFVSNNFTRKIKHNSWQQNLNETKKPMNSRKMRNDSIQDLLDLDYCIHCKQFVGGESISNVTQHSVLCQRRNIKCLTCFKCNYTTRNIRQYERHCFHGHYSTTFTCPKCQHISNNIFTYVVHRRKHLNLRPYRCDICGNHYITLHTLLRHKDIHNQTKQKLQCRMCTKTFSLKHYRREHEMTHNEKKQYKCKYCYHKTNRRMYLKKHIEMHEVGRNAVNRDRFCETCNIAFQDKEMYVIHILEKHMKNYTVLVKKKTTSEVKQGKSFKNKLKGKCMLSIAKPDQQTRKKVKIKRFKIQNNQSSKIKIIKIIKRKVTDCPL